MRLPFLVNSSEASEIARYGSELPTVTFYDRKILDIGWKSTNNGWLHNVLNPDYTFKWTDQNGDRHSTKNILYFFTPYFKEKSGINTYWELTRNIAANNSSLELEAFNNITNRMWSMYKYSSSRDAMTVDNSFDIRDPNTNLTQWILDIPEGSEDVWSFDMIKAVKFTIPFTPKWGEVLNYSFKMNPKEYKFFRTYGHEDDAKFFGVELEVNTDYAPEEIQTVAQEEGKREPFFIMKSDGSIAGERRHSYEMVTVPMSVRRLRGEFAHLFDNLDLSKFSRHHSCGMHIHVSKQSFSNLRSSRMMKRYKVAKSNKHLEKFMIAMNPDSKKNIEFLQAISEREGDFLSNRYCTTSKHFEGMRTSFKVKNAANSSGRATAHITSHTVEVRLFQGIVTKESVLKNIEFVDAVLEFTREAKPHQCDITFSTEFKKWFATQPTTKYRNLRKFMEEKGLSK